MKRIKIVINQPKTTENLNFFDIKSVTASHPTLSHKLSNTIRQTKKIAQVDADKNSTSS